MTHRDIRIGVLFSTDGPYEAVSRTMLNGCLLGIDDVNAGGPSEGGPCEGSPSEGGLSGGGADGAARGSIRLVPVIANPGGDLARYGSLAAELLGQGLRHVVGCYTSSSRKELIPLFEKADALLWYPSHYEGFECSANVIYTGAVANQHLLPLADYMLRQFGRTAFCVGSNYIWAWENNRILRERLAVSHGKVLGERYFAVGETEFDQVIAAILEQPPAFVFNTLIGVSSYRFLRDFRSACRARGIDQPSVIPVASCTLSEPELEAIGPEAADGHITASTYFASIGGAANARFVERYAARFPEGPAVCADAEAAYIAVRLLALALEQADGAADLPMIRRVVGQLSVAAPQGEVRIDPETLHAALTPRIARSSAGARFEILAESPRPVRADPYLIWNSPRFWTTVSPPSLRVAS